MKQLLLLPLLLAACDTLPRDTDGTLAQVQARHLVRVGIVAGPRPAEPVIAVFARDVATAAGARTTVATGSAESLLAALDRGRLDLVVGAWTKDTAWRDKVSLTPVIWTFDAGGTGLEVRGAVRNGENRWAMLVEHAARGVPPQLVAVN